MKKILILFAILFITSFAYSSYADFLSGVVETSPSNLDFLQYNSTIRAWINTTNPVFSGDITVGGNAVIVGSVTAGSFVGVETNKIKDADGDTYVDVEQTSDCDSIRFKAGGTYVMSMTSAGTVLEEPLNAGKLQLTADGETMTLADMAVSDTPAAGTDMSAGFKIDANDIFRYGAEADGSGGIQNEYAYINGAFIYGNAVTLADDAELAIKTGVAGFGQVFANDETMHFWFTSAGVLTKISGTANTDVADTDTDLCVYDAGAGISVKNRLGASYKVLIKITYMTP